MPRLPGPEALGGLPSMRGGSPATISGRDQIAESLGRIGQGVVALSEDQRQREDALDAAEADADVTTGLTELKRRFDTDPEWRTFQPRFEEEANRIRAEAANRIRNPRTRERWMLRADVAVSSAFDHIRRRQDHLRGEHEFDRLDRTLGELGTAYVTSPDDTTRETVRRNIEDTIELGRRTGVVSPERVRDLTRRHLYGSIEADALARHDRMDGYAALIELREGDARGQQPSTGQVSEIGLGYIRRFQDRPAGQTAREAAAADRRLRTEAAGLSEWIGENVTVPLTQLQHDALVGVGVRRGRDALKELLPAVNAGNWEATAGVMRGRTPQGGYDPYGTSPEIDETAARPAAAAPARVEFAPLPEGVTAPAGNPRSQPVRGIIMHHTGGTSLEGALRYNYVVGPGGEVYEVAPPNAVMPHVQPRERDAFGMRSRNGQFPHLTSGTTIGVAALAPNEDAITPAQREGMTRLVQQLAAEHNIPAGDIIGHGDIQAGAQGRYGRQANEGALAREFREGRIALTGQAAAPADARSEEMADMLMGQAPASRYALLPPERRRVLIRALSESLRNDARIHIDNEIDSIRRTGQVPRQPDGTTWIERAPRILVPNQAALVTRRVQEAQAQFRAVHGLTDMNDEEMELRLNDLNPGRSEGEHYAIAARARDLAVRNIGRIRDLRRRDPALAVSGTQIVGGRGEIRTGDDGQLHTVPAEDDIRVRPAREVVHAFHLLQRQRPELQIEIAADGTITTGPAHGQMDPRQIQPQTLRLTDPRLTVEDRRLIIEARIAAQARLGVPEIYRRVLRRDEAEEILNMPQRDASMTEAEFQTRWRAATDRIAQLFGPRYGAAAFDAAVAFRNLQGQRLASARSMGARLPQFGYMTPDAVTEMRHMFNEDREVADQISQEQAMWRFGFPTLPSTPEFEELDILGPRFAPPMAPRATPGIPTMSFRGQPVVPSGVDMGTGAQPTGVPGTAARYPKPPPEEVQYLRQHPEIWQEFAKDYGVEQTRQILQQNWPGAN